MAEKICKSSDKSDGIGMSMVTMLQQVQGIGSLAFKCTQVESSFLFYCGAYSHMKMPVPPRINYPQTITVNECERISKTRVMVLPNGKSIPINLNAITHFGYVRHGKVNWDKSNLYCDGSSVEYHGERHDNVMMYISGSILIEQVNIEVFKQKVVDLNTHTQLASECSGPTNCATMFGTYIFPEVETDCMYRTIRTLPMKSIEINNSPYFVNQEHKILLKKGHNAVLPTTCNVPAAYRTQYEGIIMLVNASYVPPPVDSGDINLDLEVKVTTEYLQYYAETISLENIQLQNHQVCINSIHHEMELSPFHDGYLLRRRGAIISELKCTSVTVVFPIGQTLTEKCYRNALPALLNTEIVLVDANTNIIVDMIDLHSIPCNDHYPDYIYTTERMLVYADPVLRIDHDIMINHNTMGLKTTKTEHEELDHDLLYTAQEMIKLNNLVHFQRVRQQVVNRLVDNVCSKADLCGYSGDDVSPILSFDNLLPNINAVEMMWESILNRIIQVGALLGLVNFVIYVFHLLYIVNCFRRRPNRNQLHQPNAQQQQQQQQQQPAASTIVQFNSESVTSAVGNRDHRNSGNRVRFQDID